MEYSNKYVIFLDVLGWQNEIDNPQFEKNIPDRIKAALDAIERVINKHYENTNPIHPGTPIALNFSDSFVATVPADHNLLWSASKVISFCKEVARALLELNFLVRGGISCGSVFHQNNQIFGPAFNRAYNLESKVAIYPRIVIDNNIANEFTTMNVDNDAWLLKIDDDKYFVDYLSPDLLDRLSENAYSSRMELARTIITEALEKYTRSEHQRIREKYEWYKMYCELVMKHSR